MKKLSRWVESGKNESKISWDTVLLIYLREKPEYIPVLERKTSKNTIPVVGKQCRKEICATNILLLEAASNLSDFFFRFHFHGLKRRPRAWRRDLRTMGGVRLPHPRLLLRGTPLAFLPETSKGTIRRCSDKRLF